MTLFVGFSKQARVHIECSIQYISCSTYCFYLFFTNFFTISTFQSLNTTFSICLTDFKVTKRRQRDVKKKANTTISSNFYLNCIFHFRSCMAESWYLACDFQLSILGPFLVLPLIKLSEAASLVYLLVINLIAVGIPAGLTYAKDWPPIGTLGFR